MAKHPTIKHGKIGVLLINLGTPEAPTASAVKVYLREFLSDRRVVEVPWLLWQIILRGVILPFRSGKSAKAYAKIWWKKGSPLRVLTQSQAKKLQKRIGGKDVVVDYAMRYGVPDIKGAIESLKNRGCTKILFCPLYPQYSAATVGSVGDAVFKVLSSMRWQVGIRMMPPYYDTAEYIDALKRSVLDRVHFNKKKNGDSHYRDALLISFHGLPKRNLQMGDPYYCHCRKTARLLGEALGLGEDRLFVSFQSRFGRQEWLRPYSDEVVKDLAVGGVKRLAVICPGFSVDCLETLEEVDIGLHEDFLGHGGEVFDYLPCLNDDEVGMDLLHGLVKNELLGWTA